MMRDDILRSQVRFRRSTGSPITPSVLLTFEYNAKRIELEEILGRYLIARERQAVVNKIHLRLFIPTLAMLADVEKMAIWGGV
jgi:hypothetical protein